MSLAMKEHLIEIIESKIKSGKVKATIAALAKEAGVNRTTLYKYYGDVIILVKAIACGAPKLTPSIDSRKIELMRKKQKVQTQTIELLTTICSNQLVEIAELNDRLSALNAESNFRIANLERTIASLSKGGLQIVK